MHYEVHGKPDGPTMMLLHGFLSSRVQWDLNLERLGQTLRLVIVELLGHGRSPAPTDPDAYRREVIIGRIDEIRREVGADRWWVCGQSLGGATTIRYALAHQPAVNGLIFTNSRAAFGSTRAPKDEVARIVDGGLDLRELPFHPIHARRFPDQLKARMVAEAEAIEPHAVAHTVAQRGTWSVRDDFDQLTVPTLLVNGRFERVFQPFVDDIRHALPSIEIVHLDGGHSINVEQAAAFDAAVLDFVARHGRD